MTIIEDRSDFLWVGSDGDEIVPFPNRKNQDCSRLFATAHLINLV